MKRWARKFDRCQNCGTSDKPHMGKGLCITCYANARYAANKDAEHIKRKKKRDLAPKAKKEAAFAQQQAWKDNNREKALASQSAWHVRNREQNNQNAKRRYEENKEEVSKQAKAKYAKIKAKVQKWPLGSVVWVWKDAWLRGHVVQKPAPMRLIVRTDCARLIGVSLLGRFVAKQKPPTTNPLPAKPFAPRKRNSDGTFARTKREDLSAA